MNATLAHEVMSRFSKAIGGQVTAPSLERFVKQFLALPPDQTNSFTRELASLIARCAATETVEPAAQPARVSMLAANVSGAVDVGLSWRTATDDRLTLTDARIDAGGGPTNVAKALRGAPLGCHLIALVGNADIAALWKHDMYRLGVSCEVVRMKTDSKANIINVIDGHDLDMMIGWGEPVTDDVMTEFADRFEAFLAATHSLRWATITAGGGIRSERTGWLYSQLVRRAHQRNVEMLIDFKGTSTLAEIRAVLEVPRSGAPIDVLTPNGDEFRTVLECAGLSRPTDSSTTSELVSGAQALMRRFNLRAVLLKRGTLGLTFISRDSIVHEATVPVAARNAYGAGDTANAAFLHGLCAGLSVRRALGFANRLAARTVRLPGTQVAPAIECQLEAP